MRRRRISRTLRQVPVTVSGTDRRGQPFVQSATTVNVSSHGVHLAGMPRVSSVGDLVQVQYRKRQAIYCVAWVGARGTPLEGHAGLKDQDGGKFLFADLIPAPAVEAAGGDVDAELTGRATPVPFHTATERREVERREAERRRHRRIPCAGTVHLRCGDSPVVEARINELSEGGCYVEMMSPFPIGSRLQMEIVLLGRKLHCDGEVRSSQQHFGMGVMFDAMAPEEAARLLRMLAELNGEPQLPEPEPTLANDSASRPMLGDAVLRWFAVHDALSRQEFMQLMRESTTEPVAAR